MTRIRKKIASTIESAAAVVVVVAAFVWLHRAGVIDAAAGVCGLAAFWMLSPVAGLGFAFVWLTVQAYGIERKGKP